MIQTDWLFGAIVVDQVAPFPSPLSLAVSLSLSLPLSLSLSVSLPLSLTIQPLQVVAALGEVDPLPSPHLIILASLLRRLQLQCPGLAEVFQVDQQPRVRLFAKTDANMQEAKRSAGL